MLKGDRLLLWCKLCQAKAPYSPCSPEASPDHMWPRAAGYRSRDMVVGDMQLGRIATCGQAWALEGSRTMMWTRGDSGSPLQAAGSDKVAPPVTASCEGDVA